MSEFKKVCLVTDLVKNSGVAVLVNDIQIALFYVGGEVFALNNYDPVGKANVMSRGMVGDLKGEIMVAAPLYKQHYSLKTGWSLDGADLTIPSYETKITDGFVWIKI